MAGRAGNPTRERANAASNLAWVLATCPADSIRDGARAVELGEKALRISRRQDPNDLQSACRRVRREWRLC